MEEHDYIVYSDVEELNSEPIGMCDNLNPYNIPLSKFSFLIVPCNGYMTGFFAFYCKS